MTFVKVYLKIKTNLWGEYCNACSDIGITLFARPLYTIISILIKVSEKSRKP